jgi:hypothetical protein
LERRLRYEDRDEPIRTLEEKCEIHYSALYSTLFLCQLEIYPNKYVNTRKLWVFWTKLE